jgi:hypothetical protein
MSTDARLQSRRALLTLWKSRPAPPPPETYRHREFFVRVEEDVEDASRDAAKTRADAVLGREAGISR